MCFECVQKMKKHLHENQRYSILTENLESCIICGCKKQHIHEIFYGKNRQNSIDNGFCIPLCFDCHMKIHNHYELDLYWKRIVQSKYEEGHSREDFMNIIHKNYLD